MQNRDRFDPRRRALLRLLGAAGTAALLPACGSRSSAPRRVLIVGAGMAGLTAANALRQAGVDSVIIEARDRIGGRLWTRDLGGIPVDFGGSWIHEPDGNPMSAFADQAGVARTPVDPTNDLASIEAYDENIGRSLLLPETLQAFGAYEGFDQTDSVWLDQLGPQASVKDAIEAYIAVAGAAMLPDQRARALHVTRYVHETFDAADWGDLSLEYLVNSPIVTYGGSAFGDFPVGGYTRLVQAMAGRSDVRLNHVVTRIEHGGSGVTVQALHGTQSVSFSGSHVLVTVPLGVLKAADIAFDPPLAQRKLDAIGRVGFGHFEKVGLRFDAPFWESGTPSRTHLYFVSGNADEPMELPLFLDCQRAIGQPALVGLVSGAYAQHFATLGADAIRTRVLAILREVYGTGVPAPTAVLTSGWANDPFARGSYSYLAVGSTPDDMDALAEPASERLLFAGEATIKQRYGYADGALSSGLREVKRLLGTDQVSVKPYA
ncbi:MAG: FAD-dependent oxidoreductase [Nevskiaceae bacterium]|nr:MAG: FAD-dependent oxidoreductase [Nevskiaceae bacterium]